jgi:hypothetical protein
MQVSTPPHIPKLISSGLRARAIIPVAHTPFRDPGHPCAAASVLFRGHGPWQHDAVASHSGPGAGLADLSCRAGTEQLSGTGLTD